MGTRSLTFVHEDDNDPIICIYQQFDGYFSGVGDDILSFLKGKEIVNGIGGGDTSKQFNGAGDLACRLVTHFKGGDESNIGGVYIQDPTRSDDEEYSYHIHCVVGEPPLLVAHDVSANFTVTGCVDDFVWPTDEDDEDDDVALPVGFVWSKQADTSGPLQDDQRRALFALFSRVFDSTEDDKRQVFSQGVLGKGTFRSWSTTSPDAISAAEAAQLLRALEAIEQTQQA